MTTQFSENLLNQIKTWQDKFKECKQQCGVAEMDTPGTTKDSREALHDTSNATDSIKDWRSFWSEVLDEPQIKKEDRQEAINGFADTICCALEKMDGKEVCECMFVAVTQQFEYTLKEHNKSIELLNAFVNASEKK